MLQKSQHSNVNSLLLQSSLHPQRLGLLLSGMGSCLAISPSLPQMIPQFKWLPFTKLSEVLTLATLMAHLNDYGSAL